MSTKTILKKSSMTFLENYLNNASPTGYESEGQKIWMNYLEPYVDEFITDTYGTAVAIINPKAKALIFDLDGTLADTMPVHFLAYKNKESSCLANHST